MIEIPRKSLEFYKTGSEIIAIWVGLLAALFGGAWALVELDEKRDSERMQLTMSFQKLYGEGDVRDARRRIVKAWAEEGERQDEANRFAEDEYERYILAVIAGSKLEEDISILLDYFDNVAVCVSKKLCDRDVVRSMLQRDARRLHNRHFPYLKKIRADLEDRSIGNGLFEIAFMKETVN